MLSYNIYRLKNFKNIIKHEKERKNEMKNKKERINISKFTELIQLGEDSKRELINTYSKYSDIIADIAKFNSTIKSSGHISYIDIYDGKQFLRIVEEQFKKRYYGNDEYLSNPNENLTRISIELVTVRKILISEMFDDDIEQHLVFKKELQLELIEGMGIYLRGKYNRPLDCTTFHHLINSPTCETTENYKGDSKIDSCLMKGFARCSYAGKDLYSEWSKSPWLVAQTPYLINDYLRNDNKVDFVRNSKHDISEKDIKRLPTLFTSYIRKAKQVIQEKDIDKFIAFLSRMSKATREQLDDVMFYKVKDFNEMIGVYYQTKGFTVLKGNEEYIKWDAIEYANLAKSLGEKISLTLSQKKLEQKHNELSIRIQNKNFIKKEGSLNKSVEFDKKFSKVKIEGFKPLMTVGDFVEEGVIQANCVASYVKYVRDGKCLIMTGYYNDKRFTLEIIKHKNGFALNQMMAKYNIAGLPEERQYILDILNAYNKKHFKNPHICKGCEGYKGGKYVYSEQEKLTSERF